MPAGQGCCELASALRQTVGDNPFVSPSCCADGHGGIMFALEGFDVHSVDIDKNCIIKKLNKM